MMRPLSDCVSALSCIMCLVGRQEGHPASNKTSYSNSHKAFPLEESPIMSLL